MLENDVQNAQLEARTLSTQSDLTVAEAALSAQLVELEALYQRAPRDTRVLELLDSGYTLLAQGFIEVRRLDALAAGDMARAAQAAESSAQAAARAQFYRGAMPGKRLATPPPLWPSLIAAQRSCQQRARASYEKQLHALLLQPAGDPEQRLKQALLSRLASAWLLPPVAARCGF